MTRRRVIAFSAAFVSPLLAQHKHGKTESGAATPAYLSEAEASKPLPATLPPNQFSDPQVVRAYTIAKEIPHVLAQQPCYCWCSRSVGHHSLHDCYVSDHAAHCGVCLKEALLSAELTKKGKKPAQIREEIEKGGWVNAE